MKQISVFGLIRNKADEVLLVKQRGGKRHWTLPGGKVEAKEHILDGLYREVMEECGCEVEAQEVATVMAREERRTVVLVFYTRLIKENRMNYRKNLEIEAKKYFSLDALPTPISVQAAACLFRLNKLRSGYTPFVDIEF